MEWNPYIVDISMIYDFQSTPWVNNIHWNFNFPRFFSISAQTLGKDIFTLLIVRKKWPKKSSFPRIIRNELVGGHRPTGPMENNQNQILLDRPMGPATLYPAFGPRNTWHVTRTPTSFGAVKSRWRPSRRCRCVSSGAAVLTVQTHWNGGQFFYSSDAHPVTPTIFFSIYGFLPNKHIFKNSRSPEIARLLFE